MNATPTSSRYDVVVVGARPAGAATAMLLARRGHRVLVVDRSAAGSDTLSTHALMRGGVLQLHRWGLLDRVVGAGTPAVHTARFHYPDGTVDVPITPSPGVDALYAPRRTVLDPIIAGAAAAAGADVRHGTPVTRIVEDASGRVTGVELGSGEMIEARFVVGADGARSFVARSLGVPVTHSGRHASAFVYTYVEGIATDAYEWAWAAGGMAGIIPTNDGAANVCVGLPAGTFRAATAGGVEALFHRTFSRVAPALAERVAAARRVAGFRSFPGDPGRLRQAWGPGWVLVGDAGNWKDPLSVHGLSDALRDAELAARAVDDVLSGRGGETTALAGYQEQRDQIAVPLLDVTDRMAAYDWDTPAIGALLKEQAAVIRPEVDLLLALDDVAGTAEAAA